MRGSDGVLSSDECNTIPSYCVLKLSAVRAIVWRAPDGDKDIVFSFRG